MKYYQALDYFNEGLFDKNLPYFNIEHIQRLIFGEFATREIEHDTPQLFRLRLNHFLKMYSVNYNKMFASQLMEIDPFVTDYIEETIGSLEESKEKDIFVSFLKQHGIINANTNTDYVAQELMEDDGEKDYTKDNTGNEKTNTSGTKDVTSKDTTTYNENKEFTGKELTDQTVDTTRKTDTTENTQGDKIYDKSGTNNTTYEETGIEGQSKVVSGNDNQSERNWADRGYDEGHQLNVGSDTPQAMLFNIPHLFAGTGRSQYEAIQYLDSSGNYAYRSPQEANPKEVMGMDVDIGNEETPWYNYASEATNNTGHNQYDKSGTETYKRDHDENTQTDTDKFKDGNSNDITSETYDEATTGEKETHVTESIGETTDKQVDTNQDTKTTGDKTVDGTSHEETTGFGNTDKIGKEIYKEHTFDDYTKDNTSNTKVKADTDNKLNKKGKENRDINKTVDNKTNRVKKGRTYQSPSKLLQEYRDTLMYNCDKWLLSELKPLFSDLF